MHKLKQYCTYYCRFKHKYTILCFIVHISAHFHFIVHNFTYLCKIALFYAKLHYLVHKTVKLCLMMHK